MKKNRKFVDTGLVKLLNEHVNAHEKQIRGFHGIFNQSDCLEKKQDQGGRAGIKSIYLGYINFSYVIWFMFAKSAGSYSFYSIHSPHGSFPLSFSLFLANSSGSYSFNSILTGVFSLNLFLEVYI